MLTLTLHVVGRVPLPPQQSFPGLGPFLCFGFQIGAVVKLLLWSETWDGSPASAPLWSLQNLSTARLSHLRVGLLSVFMSTFPLF